MKLKNYKTLFILFLFLSPIVFTTKLKSNEIVQDKNGNYFLIKKDGTYKKLPPPKPGFKYILKKKSALKPLKKKKKKIDTRTAKTQNQKGQRDFK